MVKKKNVPTEVQQGHPKGTFNIRRKEAEEKGHVERLPNEETVRFLETMRGEAKDASRPSHNI